MFSGVGAETFGGRWNTKGIAIVYTSESLALAAMEMLVHLDEEDLRARYVKCRVTFDESLISRIQMRSLPRGWRAIRAPAKLRALGDRWAIKSRSAVLAVPSAVVIGEWNYLLNPAHRDFAKISIGKVERFAFDPRLA
jgi:RES domain-containing protein